MTRLLILGTDQDDALECATTDRLILAHRAVGSRIELVWPTAFDRISGSEPFDDMVLTSRVATHPDAPLVSNWVAACRTRVRGRDGLTPGERIREAQA